jgi:hypothetical protein
MHCIHVYVTVKAYALGRIDVHPFSARNCSTMNPNEAEAAVTKREILKQGEAAGYICWQDAEGDIVFARAKDPAAPKIIVFFRVSEPPEMQLEAKHWNPPKPLTKIPLRFEKSGRKYVVAENGTNPTEAVLSAIRKALGEPLQN